MSKEGASATPLMTQYREIKARHPGAILFFRMGDFYEMFYEDAEVASRALDLTSGDEKAKLPPQYAEEIERLLTATDRETSAFGLELADARTLAHREALVAKRRGNDGLGHGRTTLSVQIMSVDRS